MNVLAALTVALLYGAGIHLMTRRDTVKLAAGTLLITNAAVLLLVSSGFGGYEPPLLPVENEAEAADPLVQALALTAIVIGFGTTVLMLRVALALARTHETTDVEELVDAERAEGERAEGEIGADDPEEPR